MFVNSGRRDAAPGPLRAAWLAELHPDVTVVEVVHDLPTDFGDEALWQRWIDLFRAHWPLRHGPDVVCSSDPYVAELARRLGAEPVVVDADRVRRADQRHHGPDRSRRPTSTCSPRPCGRGSRRSGVSVSYLGWGTMRMYGLGAFHPSG